MRGWKENTIEEVIEKIATGKTPPTSNREYFDGDINWYTPQDILNTIALNGSSRKISSKAFEDRKAILFEPNTLLITCIGNIGRIGLATIPSSSNQQITGLKFKPFIYPKYAFYYFQYIQPQLADQANNAVVPILNNATLKEFKIRYPDLDTQKQIAQLLEEADIARQKRKAASALTDEFLQSTFLSMFGDPIVNNKKWSKKFFKQICNIEKRAIAPDKIAKGSYYVGLEHIEKNSGELIGFLSTSEIELMSTKFCFTSKHILYGKLRPYLNKVCLPSIAGVCSTDILPIVPKQNIANKYFLAFLMRQPFFIEKVTTMSTGANLPRISPKILEEFKVICPPFSLQQKFASIVAATEQLRQKQKQSEIELENLFQALLQKYFE